MALEAVVFQQDPFNYGCKDFYSLGGNGPRCTYNVVGLQVQEEKSHCITEETLAESSRARGFGFSATGGSSSPSLMVQYWDTNSCFPDHNFFVTTDGFSPAEPPPAYATSRRRKRRRRTKSVKNRDEIENQRMTHIIVERNRRRQMNDYLSALRSMMPTSYVQRGYQASIIGGAINFIKELEQRLQSLEARKRIEKRSSDKSTLSSIFSDLFSFPDQYSSGSTATRLSCAAATGESMAEKRSSFVADVEVIMVESHANLKILSEKHPKQLLKMVSGLHSLGLLVLHLNVTSIENRVLYSFSVKVEDNCQLTTVNGIAAAVYEMVDRVQEEEAA